MSKAGEYMKIMEEYTFVTIMNQSYLVPINTKDFMPSDAIGFNEAGSFLMGEIANGIHTKEELITKACKEFETENEEEEKEVADMVHDFVLYCVRKGYIGE